MTEQDLENLSPATRKAIHKDLLRAANGIAKASQMIADIAVRLEQDAKAN